MAAEEIAVLDNLCEGRLILGLGRGIQPEVFEAFGIESRSKRDLFSRSLEIMRRAWGGQDLAEGKAARPVKLAPAPPTAAGPTLWAAAMGPKALRQIAELGLPYLASPVETLDQLRDNYRDYNTYASQAGPAPTDTVPIVRTIFIDERPSRCTAMLEALRKQVPPRLSAKAGSMEDVAIVGPRALVTERLAALKDLTGVTHLVARGGLPGLTPAEQVACLEQLATAVTA